MNTFILNQAMPTINMMRKKTQEFRVDSNGKILRKRKTPWYINSLALSEDDDEIKE
jgi:hypothetical protein